MSTAATTTDHDQIKRWVEQRDGQPARVKSAGKPGLLRIEFSDPDEELETISWDTFFEAFEESRLAFLHQDHTDDGKISRFNKFVDRA